MHYVYTIVLTLPLGHSLHFHLDHHSPVVVILFYSSLTSTTMEFVHLCARLQHFSFTVLMETNKPISHRSFSFICFELSLFITFYRIGMWQTGLKHVPFRITLLFLNYTTALSISQVVHKPEKTKPSITIIKSLPLYLHVFGDIHYCEWRRRNWFVCLLFAEDEEVEEWTLLAKIEDLRFTVNTVYLELAQEQLLFFAANKVIGKLIHGKCGY